MFNLLVRKETVKELKQKGYYFVEESNGNIVSIYNKFSHPICTFVQTDNCEILVLTNKYFAYVNNLELHIEPPTFPPFFWATTEPLNEGEPVYFLNFYDLDYMNPEDIQYAQDLIYLHWYEDLHSVNNMETMLERLEEENGSGCVYEHAGFVDLEEPQIMSDFEYRQMRSDTKI